MMDQITKKRKKTRHLGRKINILVTGLQVISIAVILVVCVRMFYVLVMDMLQDRCVNGTNMLSYQLKNYSGAEDKTQLLDSLKEQMGCEFTIFRGDERAYTTIQNNGERAVGTKLSDDLAEIVLEKGESYVGKAEILGVEHLCSYVPTKDSKGKVDGLVFAGISMETANSQISLTVWLAVGAGVLLIILGVVLVLCFVRRSVSKPLSGLSQMAYTMERGELGLEEKQITIPDIRSNDEIGLLAWTFENTMNRLRDYIGEISHVLAAISQGDLTVQTRLDYVGDFVSIKNSLDNILAKLNGTMSQIAESADFVSGGSEQMSTAAQALSQGALEQASTVEELDMTMRDISEHVGQTAQSAQQAGQKVSNVGGQLRESNEKMQQMIRAMEEINSNSSEIGKIIKTIENIAFQTNILALNSAVEAARAGKAGEGFAVVAGEVRELAAKSSEASQSTAELIEKSIKSVEYGAKIASETAEQLASVVQGAAEVEETTSWIAEASATQAQSVSDIQQQISQISEVVQMNSATAEESAATSQELSSQAMLLKNLIDLFQLKRSGN